MLKQVSRHAGAALQSILPISAPSPAAEKRAELVELGDLTGGRLHMILGDSASGERVNETTATGVPAVVACVTLLADMVAKLPIHLFKDSGKVPEEIKSHPALYAIAKHPSDLHTSFELRHLMECGRGFGGNGYSRVWRRQDGTVDGLEWLKPCDVEPFKPKNARGPGGYLAYKVDGVKDTLTSYNVLHVRRMSRDGIKGESPIRHLRESIGTALQQTKAAGRLMKQGANFPGFLKVEGITDPKKLAEIREEVNAKMAGAINAGKIPVVGGTMSFEQTNGMTMTDAQFIDSRRFELHEIARIYRVPPFLIGDTTASTSWGTGLEQMTLGFLNFSLDPHLVGWEQAMNATLLSPEERAAGYFFRFDRDELIAAALKDRAGFYQIMRNIGVYSPNDVRAKLNEPLIPADQGGDDYGKPLNANVGETKQPQPDPQSDGE